jgi:GDP-L-fucose synthase
MIPSMIHRAFLANKNKEKMVVWGDGSPLRQVIYSEDLARLIIWSLDNWKNDEPFMAINPDEITILEIAKEICNNFNIYEDNLIFDDTKPKGQHRKPASSDALPEFKFTPLSEGIKESVKWFLNNYPNIRK